MADEKRIVTLEVEVEVSMDESVVARAAEYGMDVDAAAEHLARMRVEVGRADVSQLDGWADLPEGAGTMAPYGLDVTGPMASRYHEGGPTPARSPLWEDS